MSIGAIALKIFFQRSFAKDTAGGLKITSVFSNLEKIPKKYTCDGENFSPELFISGVSTQAKSLVFIMDDPDAPMVTFTHWLVYNIPTDTGKISSQSLPKGALQGLNDFEKIAYGGPCPPSGIHRYYFKLYSIDKILDLKAGVTVEELLKAIDHHVLQKAELIGSYSRN